MVYHVEELAALRKTNAKECARKELECPQYRCNEATERAIARCDSGSCVREFESLFPGRMEDGFFVAKGASSPRYCDVPDDCIGDTTPAEGGCCNDPTTLTAYSKGYRAWLENWREEHCADVDCPPPPAPAKPADCHFEMTCVDNQCGDRCDEG
jgi:hypothetical protein